MLLSLHTGAPEAAARYYAAAIRRRRVLRVPERGLTPRAPQMCSSQSISISVRVMKSAQLCSPSRHVIRRPADALLFVGRDHRP